LLWMKIILHSLKQITSVRNAITRKRIGGLNKRVLQMKHQPDFTSAQSADTLGENTANSSSKTFISQTRLLDIDVKMASISHTKVWESMLVAGGIVFAFGVIWGAFLLAKRFTEAQGALVLAVIGIILLVLSESILISYKK